MLKGTIAFDEGVDSSALPAHLASCLARVHAREVRVDSNSISFSGGLFRFVSNWNVLVQFGTGELKVETRVRRVGYRVSVRQLVFVSTALCALVSIPVIASCSWSGMAIVSFLWLWLVGGNLAIGVPRFRSFIRHCIESAPRLSDNHALNSDVAKATHR
jgi:hypothetical protein